MKRVAGTAGLVSVLAAAGCGGISAAAPKLTEAKPAVAKRLMVERLRAKHVDYTWLACVSVGRRYRHVPITRCNVGFGIDPHVEAYCVVLEDGRLVTSHEDARIPCKHDDAGSDGTTITIG
ncbi:MAG: hypothetical protein IRZ04_07225 [Rhodospirillales bacterium]|nr:hypothetical protein [Rhodospirillales bacterium]